MTSLLDTLVEPVVQLLDSPEMMHAAAVHLPVAIAVIGLPIALASLLPARLSFPIRWAGIVCYGLLMTVAYVATRTGEDALELVPNTLPAYMWADINEHESMAERVWIFGAVTASLFLLSVVKAPRIRWTASALALIASMATLGWVIQVGHHGGTLVYKHGLGTPPLYVETHRYEAHVESMTQGLSQEEVAAAAKKSAEASSAPIQEATLRTYTYAQDILPMLQEYCTGCHSPDELEGGLDLTTIKGMLAGGEKSGPAILLGKPDASPLLLYVRGERQPQMPKEEPVLSESNIRILANWVARLTPQTLEQKFELLAKDTLAIEQKHQQAASADSLLTQINVFLKIERSMAKAASNKEKAQGPLNGSLSAAIQNYEQEFEKRQALIRKVRAGLEEPELKRPADAPSEKEKRVHDRPRPDPEQRRARMDLRFALIAEHPPSESTTRHSAPDVFNSYTLFDPDAYLRLGRDLRKQWLPAMSDLPGTDSDRNPIDRFIDAKLERDGLAMEFELCGDSAFLRRVYLDLHGVIPSADEARSFLSDPSSGKRRELIEALLAQDEDYAASWVPFWEDALCSTHSNPNISPFGKHGDYRKWIFDSFKKNKPYDVWVRELLDPFAEDHPPNYVLRRTQMDLLQSAANTAQVFLGTAMKCSSCHNNFSNAEWTQGRFYSFASFMDKQDMEVFRCEKATGRIVPTKFAWDIPGKVITAPKAGLYSGSPFRMAMFAELLTDPNDPRFAPTLVNRLWKRFIGTGLFEPADDFRLGETLISHPGLLDWLANDLIEHNYDLKYAIRQIMLSDTYQRKYIPDFEDEFSMNDPDRPRHYRSPILRRLWAEQILDSINRALGVPMRGYARTFWNDEITPLMAALGRPISRDEVSTDRIGDGAILMGLELINSPEYYERIYSGPAIAELAGRWGEGALTEAIIEDIYMSVLSRAPTKEELQLAIDFLNPERPPRNEDFATSFRAPSFDDALKNVQPGGTIRFEKAVSLRSPRTISAPMLIIASLDQNKSDAATVEPEEQPLEESIGAIWVENEIEPGIAKRTLLGDMYWALFTSPEFQYIH